MAGGALLLLVLWFGFSKIVYSSSSDNWIEEFLQGKKVYDQISKSVASGARIGIEECKEQFRWDLWNCNLTSPRYQLPVFVKTMLPNGNRETAFVHAISIAGIVHTLTRNCSRGDFDGCMCTYSKRSNKRNSDWRWEGCGENVMYGEIISKRFVDDLEIGKGARTAMNLQNNEVGRKVVRNAMLHDCRCHGVSGSCQVRTCWNTLSPFSQIGEILKKKYHKAKYVKYHDNKVFIVPSNRTKKSRPLPKRDESMIYLQRSPNYCVKNESLGSYGALGRVCRSTDKHRLKICEKSCSSCNYYISRSVEYRMVKCKCRFNWCCTVTCKNCKEKVHAARCTAGKR